MSTILDSIESAPSFSARTTSEPDPATVPPTTWSPSDLLTGRGSPVTMDSSTLQRPDTTVPSTATFSPGRTRTRSPTCRSSSGISDSLPCPSIRLAVAGARSIRARMAPEVDSRARSSSTCPRATRATITDAASKYTSTRPCMRMEAGKMPGVRSATRL